MQTIEKSKSLVGSWSAVITATNLGITFPGLLTFTSDGIMLANEPPSPYESLGHGSWISSGPFDAAYTFFVLVGSAEGNLSSKMKVSGSLHYDISADCWEGPFKLWAMDADNKPTDTNYGIVTCKHIAVEMLE